MSHVGRIWGHMYTQFEVNRLNPSPSGYCLGVGLGLGVRVRVTVPALDLVFQAER